MSVLSKIDTSLALPEKRRLQDRLADGLAPKLLPVFADIHAEIVEGLDAKHHSGSARSHAEALAQYCLKQAEIIAEFAAAEQQFQTRLTNAVDTAEERAAILDFARSLGADRRQLQSDRRAFGAWFDADAVIERYQKRIGERERALAHGIERLGLIAADYAATDPLMSDTAFFIDLADRLLNEMRHWRGDARVRQAVHSCLAAIAMQIDHWPFGYWFEDVLSATRRVCLDEGEDVWVQCAAFDALMALSPASIATAVKARLEHDLHEKKHQAADNDLFLRRHLVRLISANLWRDEAFPIVLARLAEDKSGAVRQSLADCIHLLPSSLAAERIFSLRNDADPQVRAAMFADVPRFLEVIKPGDYAAHIDHILNGDEDEFVLRIALDAASVLAEWCRDNESDCSSHITAIAASITAFKQRRLSPKFMRWADEANERVWLASDAEALQIASIIRAVTQDQREADIRSIKPLAKWLGQDEEKVGRVMAALAQNDFGLSLQNGQKPTLQRGEWIKRRLWRIWFEGRHSATDKRQAHVHTTGRHYHGTLIAPSARMSELAPTKVPGEPLFESKEGGWRNYLPLIDQVLSALDHGRPLQLFTSAGITDIAPPTRLRERLRAFISITRGFAQLAELRNREPAEFLTALRGLGVGVDFRSYSGVADVNPEIATLLAPEKDA